MTFEEIKLLLVNDCGEKVIAGEKTDLIQPQLFIEKDFIADVCKTLQQHEHTYFDFLSCITAIDNGPAIETMDILYHLSSLPYGHSIVLKVSLQRYQEGQPEFFPSLPTVSKIFRTANWHEREIFDFIGIKFLGHPEMRRIFLPEDWKGHPLRKDYAEEANYHGIQIKY